MAKEKKISMHADKVTRRKSALERRQKNVKKYEGQEIFQKRLIKAQAEVETLKNRI